MPNSPHSCCGNGLVSASIMSILSGEITLNNSPNRARFNESFEQNRAQIAIVIFGDRALEDDVGIALHKLGMPSAAESLSTARRIAFHQSSLRSAISQENSSLPTRILSWFPPTLPSC